MNKTKDAHYLYTLSKENGELIYRKYELEIEIDSHGCSYTCEATKLYDKITNSRSINLLYPPALVIQSVQFCYQNTNSVLAYFVSDKSFGENYVMKYFSKAFSDEIDSGNRKIAKLKKEISEEESKQFKLYITTMLIFDKMLTAKGKEKEGKEDEK